MTDKQYSRFLLNALSIIAIIGSNDNLVEILGLIILYLNNFKNLDRSE